MRLNEDFFFRRLFPWDEAIERQKEPFRKLLTAFGRDANVPMAHTTRDGMCRMLRDTFPRFIDWFVGRPKPAFGDFLAMFYGFNASGDVWDVFADIPGLIERYLERRTGPNAPSSERVRMPPFVRSTSSLVC